MASKRSRAQSHDDDDDDQQSAGEDGSSTHSTPPTSSKRARRGTVNGNTNGHVEHGEEDAEGDEEEDDEGQDVKPSAHKKSRANGQPADDDEYQPGAIRRVKLTNFVTYEHAEFFPGPSLNMVIGPNGTGKSSLVCAICLGLGYPSNVLGRASAFGEFVKLGKNRATVEIELQKRPGDRDNFIVSLQINREDNSRKFKLNGRDATIKKIAKLNSLFRIQIDNLCQFLPQDKVAEFAGLNPVELLSKTLQAAAPPEMIQWQHELKDLYNRQKKFEAEHSDDAAQLARLENRQESLQADVERLRERQRISAEIDKLKDICAVAEYNESRAYYQGVKKELRDLERKKRRLEERFRPALAGVSAKESYKNQVAVVLDTRKRVLKDAEDDAQAKVGKSDATVSKVEAVKIELDGNETFMATKRKEAAELKRKITELRGRHSQKPKEFNAAEWNQKIVSRGTHHPVQHVLTIV